MIYEVPTESEGIRQGDIFVRLPRIEVSLDEVLVLGDTEDHAIPWGELAKHTGQEPITMAVAARPVAAIVITQDCDTIRAPQITLCEVKPIEKVIGTLGTKSSQLIKNIPKQTRLNLKWFYLPADPSIGFSERMAADFHVTLSVQRNDLERLRTLRVGRLNHEAGEHFRERLAEYYRRYPVDEWYPFTRDEFAEYKKEYVDAVPRPYQAQD